MVKLKRSARLQTAGTSPDFPLLSSLNIAEAKSLESIAGSIMSQVLASRAEDNSGIYHLIHLAQSDRGLNCIIIKDGPVYSAYCPQLLLVASGDTEEEVYHDLLKMAVFHLDTLTIGEVEEELKQADQKRDSLLQKILEPKNQTEPVEVRGGEIPVSDLLGVSLPQNT